MKTLEMQQSVCARYGLTGVPPEPMVALAVETVGAMPIYGTRLELGDGDNVGWFLHCGEFSDATDFYGPVHTDHLKQLLPQVISYLRLPPGSRFIIDDRGYEDVWTELA
ncbi:hypothetical protein C5E45_23535 [Nocardia nova]|uniref:Imm33-like domain-containing protein n=1 Tax=Nocardia nova TaxID=37330 RepID=A0A2S6AKX4_9NOCA|nr:hypothetical protein [Nocardia nova]PPJ22352.1 hypothetical protein C5E41_27735 [Nocardia nova]PPJ35874.1 hypothetical protein C5E45_23535 [Nocardia nova]